jgi:hypothetical protein
MPNFGSLRLDAFGSIDPKLSSVQGESPSLGKRESVGDGLCHQPKSCWTRTASGRDLKLIGELPGRT